jgi:hypothetical protein
MVTLLQNSVAGGLLILAIVALNIVASLITPIRGRDEMLTITVAEPVKGTVWVAAGGRGSAVRGKAYLMRFAETHLTMLGPVPLSGVIRVRVGYTLWNNPVSIAETP